MELINKFKNYLLSQKQKPSLVTVKNYAADIRHFISWFEVTFQQSFSPSEVRLQTIEQFKTNKKGFLSASSLERHISSLRKFFSFLKLEGIVGQNPFELVVKEEIADPWHLKEFKDFLYVYNASHLTIKNYLIDIKQFLKWAQEVSGVTESYIVSEQNVLPKIDTQMIEEYKQRLIEQHVFSPTSINRKLSSLRKYFAWASHEGLLQGNIHNPESIQIIANTIPLPKQIISNANQKVIDSNTGANSSSYSTIPPLRLFQKILKGSDFLVEYGLILPLARIAQQGKRFVWKLRGKPVFISTPTSLKLGTGKYIPRVKNISKSIYAPLEISIAHFPITKKLFYHLRHTRPNWYRKYHQLAFAHYMNWAILIIFSTAIGFGMYSAFVQKAPGSLAVTLPSAPPRILSFQGRLTDTNDNPITARTDLRFAIYDNITASAPADLLWQENLSATPDSDGIFSVLLGNNTAIPATLFQNPSLFLGVTVAQTPELTPRQQLATVAYATNAEQLQGLVPITAGGAGTNNVVLALDGSGNLTIGAGTTFQSTSGTFTLSGNALTLNTIGGSNNSIVINPDGKGFVDLQKPLINSSHSNNILSAAGAVETDTMFAVLATSSGQSALTIAQNGSGPIISASHSGTAEFTVDASGNTTSNVFYTGLGTTYYINNATSNLNSLTLANNLTVSGNVASSLIPSATDTYDLGSNPNSGGKEWNNLYVKNIFTGSNGVNGFWQLQSNVISPANEQNDLAVGGVGTPSANLAPYQIFALSYANDQGTVPAGTATRSGNITFRGTAGSQTQFKVDLLNGSSLVFNRSVGGDKGETAVLTLGNDGNITDAGNLAVNGGSLTSTQTTFNLLNSGVTTLNFGGAVTTANLVTAATTVHLADSGVSNTLSIGGTGGGTTTVNNALTATGTFTASGNTTLGSSNANTINPVGVFSGSLIPQSTTINLGSNANNFGTLFVQNVALPIGQNGIGGYWQLTNGALSPNNLQNDLFVGGNATSSATFHVYGAGVNQGTLAVASIAAQTSFAGLVVDNKGVGDLITASTSGLTKFTILKSGSIKDSNYITDKGILYADSTGLFSQTLEGASNTVLHGNASGVPTFSAIDLSSADVINTLPIARGGTNGSATPTNAEVAYGNGSAYAFTTSGSTGQCLTFNSGSAPTWSNCAAGSGVGGFWTLDSNNGVLYPVNATVDLLVGGTATTSATPAKFAVTGMAGSLTPAASVSATVSSGGTGNGIVIKGDGSIQSLEDNQLILGGNTTGDIILKPANGSGNGYVTINGNNLTSNGTTFNLFTGATTLTIGGTSGTATFQNPTLDDNQATLTLLSTPTTVNFGGTSQALTLKGNVTLGNSSANTITANGLFNSSIISNSSSLNIGSPSNYWGTVYANNFISPIGNGISGLWQVTSNVISPVNAWQDLAVGGTGTPSANLAPYQIFALSYANDQGTVPAGTATTSGNLIFRGTAGSQTQFKVDLLKGSSLVFNRSVGGDKGETAVLTLGNDGNITDAGNLAVNGGTISTTQTTAVVFNTTVTNLSIGQAATTINFGVSGGTITVPSALNLSGNFNPTGQIIASLIPNSTTVNLGSLANPYGAVYANNFLSPTNGSGVNGYWQLSGTGNAILSPRLQTNDLAIGNNATGSATPIQIFGLSYTNDQGTVPAGTATTSGNLIFRGTAGSQTQFKVDLLNGSSLVFNRSVGGDKGETAQMTLNNDGSITDAGSLAVNGSALTSTTTSFSLLNSGVTTLNFANAAATLHIADNSITNTLSIGGNAGTTTVNNALTITGTMTANGNVALGTNATNTIVFNGVANSDIVPNAADTRNLGSATSEWNNLYVRQIISPNTGGVAGYWQLNSGVLSPTTLTNDLTVGGLSTASARFQVFASGNGAGTISALLNDPKVNTNTGVYPTQQNIVNLASADHSYMKLTNSDLTIGGHKNIVTLSNVNKVFVYDTSKDTDGGRWTNDERAQTSSWYNETRTSPDVCVVGTNIRCGQQAFPRKAIIVIDNTKLYIFDAKDNSLWMQFTSGAHNMILNSTGTLTSVFALNGELYVTSTASGTSFTFSTINFRTDNSLGYGVNTTCGSDTAHPISQRNAGFGDSVCRSSYPNFITNSGGTDVSASVVNGKTYWAESNVANARGAVAVYNESDQTPVGVFGPNAKAQNVWLTSTGTLYATVGNASTPTNYALKIKYNVQDSQKIPHNTAIPFDDVYAYVDSTHYGAANNGDSNTFGTNFWTGTNGGPASTSATFIPAANSMYVTEGTSTVDGKSDTVYLGAQGSGGSLMVYQLKKGDPNNASVKYYTNTYISDDMPGDIRGMWPLSSAVGSGLTDVSAKADNLVNGVTAPTYSASGVRNQAATLTGASYAVASSSAVFAATANGLSVSAWVRPTTLTTASGVREMWVSADKATAANKVSWGIGTKGGSGNTTAYCFATDSGGTTTELNTTVALFVNTWYHVALTVDTAGNIKCYVNGEAFIKGTYSNGTGETPTAFNIGHTSNTVNISGVVGNVDDVTLGANTWTDAEIARMYQVGLRAIQNHTSKTIRGLTVAADQAQQINGGSSNISAVAASMQNGQIYIGTTAGGVSVIGMDNDTISDLYYNTMTTTDDTGTSWVANNNTVNSISLGQSYGNGVLLGFGSNNGGSGGFWMESQDTTLKDFFATNYNPFGATLNQTNLNIDSVLRVSNQISTRFDNLALDATSSAALFDVFRVDNNGALLSRSASNSAVFAQFQNSSGTTLMDLDTQNMSVGIGARPFAGYGLDIEQNSYNAGLLVDQLGSSDVMTASVSGSTQFRITNGGSVVAHSFYDIDSYPNYFLDPAAAGTSLQIDGDASTSGSLVFDGNTTKPPTIKVMNGNDLQFRTSSGLNAFTTRMTLTQAGNLGIGIQPTSLLDAESNFSTPQNWIVTGGTITANPDGNYHYGVESFPEYNASGTQTGLVGVAAFSENTGAGTITDLRGLQAQPENTSTGTVTTMYGLYSIPQNTSSGTIGTMYGIFDTPQKSGTGTITTAYGEYIQLQNTNATNAITTGYGLYIDNPTVTGPISTKYALITGSSAGNVGIGTTTPSDLLDIAGNATESGDLTFRGAGTTHNIYAFNQGNLDFQTSPGGSIPTTGVVHALYIQAGSGNVGVGSTSPTYPLDIGSTNTHTLANYGYLNSSGQVGSIGAGGGGAQQFSLHTAGRIASGGEIDVTSDQRLKNFVENLSPQTSLHAISQLTPLHFQWKPETNRGNFVDAGFFAQQVEQIIPEAVMRQATTLFPDERSLDYNMLTTYAISALQGLNEKVDSTNSAIFAQLTNLQHVNLDTSGDIDVIANAQPASSTFITPNYYTITDAVGNPMNKIGAFMELVVGNIRTGGISAQEIAANSLAIATDNISISGQSLHDYIAGIVSSMINSQSTVNSPVADIDQLHTSIISPLGQDDSIALHLGNSRIDITNGASGSAVASIDSAGNATFSGSLNSKNLAVNGDATISGTLHANRIEANTIAGLEAVVSTLSAQNITNVNNIYFSTFSAQPSGKNFAMGSGGTSASSSGALALDNNFDNLASYSSYFAYVPNLKATTAQFDQGFMSLGPASLSDTTITGQLSIGSNLILADNSVNVLGADFAIQPLRQGGIQFEGGQIAMDTNGNLTVNGKAIFNGALATNIISPLSNNQDLTIQLGRNTNATGSAVATSNLSVYNASGSGIFTIDQLGNVIASGAANIAKLNFTAVQPALAVSDTETIATGSAGTAAIHMHQTQITIDDPLVTDKSLIYITPVGQSGVTPYLLQQVADKSFTVGIPLPQFSDTTFNWLLVN